MKNTRATINAFGVLMRVVQFSMVYSGFVEFCSFCCPVVPAFLAICSLNSIRHCSSPRVIKFTLIREPFEYQ